MSEICNTCGLPKELCVCETIAKESQKITVFIEKRKFGKKYTVVDGVRKGEIDVKDLTKKLKSRFACGGTAKESSLELQGDHLSDIKEALINLGFSPDQIEVKQGKHGKK